MIYSLAFTAEPEFPVCNPLPMVFVVLTSFLGITYSAILCIKFLQTKTDNKEDYLIFMAIVTFPLFGGFLYLMSTA